MLRQLLHTERYLKSVFVWRGRYISIHLQDIGCQIYSDFISVLLYFSGPSGSMTPIHLVLRIEFRSSRCTFHYLSWTDSIKQFAIFFLYFRFGCSRAIDFLYISYYILNKFWFKYTSVEPWCCTHVQPWNVPIE